MVPTQEVVMAQEAITHMIRVVELGQREVVICIPMICTLNLVLFE